MSDNQESAKQVDVDERRRSTRETLLIHAVTARIHTSEGRLIIGSVQDLSTEGALIHAETDGLKTGDLIQIIFIFPLNHKIDYRGTVQHIEAGKSFGVEFLT